MPSNRIDDVTKDKFFQSLQDVLKQREIGGESLRRPKLPVVSHDFSKHMQFEHADSEYSLLGRDDVVDYLGADEAIEAGVKVHEIDGTPLGADVILKPQTEEDFWSYIQVAIRSVFRNLEPTFKDDIVNEHGIPNIVSGASAVHSYAIRVGAPTLRAIRNSTLGAKLSEEIGPSAFQQAVGRVLSKHLDESIRSSVSRDDAGATVFAVKKFTEETYWNSVTSKIGGAVDRILLKPSVSTDYPFNLVDEGKTAIGHQLIYRQDWRLLSKGAGEVIRTIPLGPKQTEKVTIKNVRNFKRTSERSALATSESESENSNTTKDASEITREATESNGWHFEASAEASFGFGGASMTAGAKGESSETSGSNVSTLNEAMSKAASKLKQETKVVVSTETEAQDEFVRVSEITNPNEEIAVTYVYYRQQVRYEIHTYLAQINACIYVAEYVPTPAEITVDWILRYDWILARNLIDTSFLQDLNVVRAGPGESRSLDSSIGNLMGRVGDRLGSDEFFKDTNTPPNVLDGPQQSYERELERQTARAAAQDRHNRAARRLVKHITDNILHYFRVILENEDPSQRLLRFREIEVPVDWVCSASPSGRVEACFPKGAEKTTLADLIDPTGPIGFAGNYAVYYLRQDGRFPQLDAAVDRTRLPYIKHIAELIEASTTDPAPEVTVEIGAGIIGHGVFEFVWRASEGKFRLSREVTEGDARPTDISIEFADSTVEAEDVRLRFGSEYAPADGDLFKVEVKTVPVLEDPQLKKIRFKETPVGNVSEGAAYSREVIKNMRMIYEEVETGVPEETGWSDLEDAEKDRIRRHWPHYLLWVRSKTEVTVDTDNVVLDLEVGETPILEAFKSLHRFTDVLSATADLNRKEVENERRRLRVDGGDLSDPDIDAVTINKGEAP